MGRVDHHRGQERVRGAAEGQREEQGVHLHDHNASVYAAATRRLLKASYPSGHTTNHQIVSLGEDCPFSPFVPPWCSRVCARVRASVLACQRHLSTPPLAMTGTPTGQSRAHMFTGTEVPKGTHSQHVHVVCTPSSSHSPLSGSSAIRRASWTRWAVGPSALVSTSATWPAAST